MHVLPPDEIFLNPPLPLEETQGAYTISNFVDLSYSKKEGMMSNYLHHPFPRKGFVWSEAIENNNIVKKIGILIVCTLASPSTFFENFFNVTQYALRNAYLSPRFYCKFSKELWKLTHLFLRKLGLNDFFAYGIGRVIATVFQFEEGYRWRGEDLFGQTTKLDLLNQPKKEIKKMYEIYKRREKGGITNKLGALVKLLSFALYIPKVRKAWNFAIKQMQIENLVLDEGDRWHGLAMREYDFEDRDIEDRFKEHVDIYNWHQIKLIKQRYGFKR